MTAAPHLIGIGRLGGQDSEGWHHVMIKPDFRSDFVDMDSLYLIFASDRVFYVTISDRKQCDKKTWVKFTEEGIAEERKLHKEVILAIDQDDEDEDSVDDYIGFTAVYADTVLGTISDVFFNNAQDVLVLETSLGREILVPVVDYYVDSFMEANRVVFLKNMDELLASEGFKIHSKELILSDED